MIYKWRARQEVPGTPAHLEHADYQRALCGLLKPAGSTWSDDTMLLACRPRCKSCERRQKQAKYWMTAVHKGENT